MSERRPEPVRLDDLADPQIPADRQPIVDALTAYGETLTLDADHLCARASEQTGLDTWGDGAFRDRLSRLCRSLRDEAELSAAGTASVYEMLTQLLRNRLLLEDLIAQHPEIERVPIERPIVICGLPRTGTTHLHNLLSADPKLRHLPYWESLEPVLAPGEMPAPGEPDPRLARCEMALDHVNGLLPHFRRMHEMTVDHAHEEIQLLAIDIAGMLFETTAPMPQWRDAYKDEDQTSAYRYLRRALQALTWLRGPTRWVLKSPQHLEQFEPLLETFPDATFVVTHRDPVAVTVSMCTMIAYSARVHLAKPDPRALAAYWSARTADLLNACLAHRDVLPDAQTIDVRLDDLVADELGTVARIYALAGQPLDASARAGMAQFVADHPRGRHGTVVHDLDALGLDHTRLRVELRPYAERFGVRDEGVQ
jgi:hypothetical protein